MSAHMDELIAQFQNFQTKVRQAEARFAGVEDMQERIAQVENTVRSPDGNVTVTAGAGGTVTDLRLAAGATRLEAGQLAGIIMNTLRQAVAGAVQKQAGIVDDAFGDAFNVDVSAQVRQAQTEAFGAVAEPPAAQQQQHQPLQQPGTPAEGFASYQQPPQPQASPPRRRPSPRNDDDDYFDDNSILRRD
ncbi:YbaB/EbfC family nucleoid-associated protein [Amycolatopsis sp. NPDC059027]|uniref:YbaB/EbfC family nucleoid-associated protein n=1 Tax=Amycolatopsis sp. NPDC059027 TaxID=3346709 RepID=UPI003670E59A